MGGGAQGLWLTCQMHLPWALPPGRAEPLPRLALRVRAGLPVASCASFRPLGPLSRPVPGPVTVQPAPRAPHSAHGLWSAGAGLWARTVPTFHEEPVHVGALSGGRGHVFPVLLGHLHREAHLVQRPLVLPGHGLHDGREEGLGVEEAGQPHGGGQGEVRGPGLQLLRGEGSQPSARASRQMVQPLLPCHRSPFAPS